MSPEAQRIAIAEACGWRCIQDSRKYHKDINGLPPTHVGSLNVAGTTLPDYLNDLNAMHDARNAVRFTVYQHGEYVEHLIGAVTRANPDWMCRCNPDMCIDATAAQRAEAFLRTLSKWQEAPK